MKTHKLKSALNVAKARSLTAFVVLLFVSGCSVQGGTITAFTGQNSDGQTFVSFTTDFVREALAAFLF